MASVKERLRNAVDAMPEEVAERLLAFLDEILSVDPDAWESSAILEGRQAHEEGRTLPLDAGDGNNV